MKRSLSPLLLFAILALFESGSPVQADYVTRYSGNGAVSASANTLYEAMTTGTSVASRDSVLLTGDALRGTSAFALSVGTFNVSSSCGSFTLSKSTDDIGPFLTTSGSINLYSVTFDGQSINSNTGGGAITGGVVNIYGNTTFVNNLTTNVGGAIKGSMNIYSGTNVFDNNSGNVNGGVINGTTNIYGGTNTFSNNKSNGGASGAIGESSNISGGNNSFVGNHALYGGMAHGTVVISGGSNYIANNTSPTGGAINGCGGHVTISGGTTIFENNVCSTDKGGAINLWFGGQVKFSGNDTVVLFRNNRNSQGPNDISWGGNNNVNNAVSFTGNGLYSFGSGVVIPTLTATGGNIAFEAGSVSNVSTQLSLTNTNLTVHFGAGADPTTSSTRFSVGTADTSIVDEGGNSVKFVLNEGFTGTSLITGNATGLTTAPVVQLAGNQPGLAYVSSSDASGVKITRIDSPTGALTHFATSGSVRTEKENRNELYSSTAIANNDCFVLSGNVTRGANAVDLTSGTNLTIQSSSAAQRTISLGAGETGAFITGAGTIALDGINISGGTSTAITSTAVILSGNTALTNNSILGAGGGAIVGNVTINGADSTVTLSNNSADYGGGAVLGNLTINQGTNTFADNYSAFKDVTSGGAVVRGKLTINNGTNTFVNNKSAKEPASQNGGGVANSGVAITGGTNTFKGNEGRLGGVTFGGLSISGGTNEFTGNVAYYGGVTYSGLSISGGTNLFIGNRASNSGGVTETSQISVSGGTNLFLNNSCGSQGGAFYAQNDVTFSGTDTVAVFKGNKMGSSPNDIYARNASSKVTFKDIGDYYFDGGIRTPNLDITGGNVTLAGNSTSLNWTTDNAYIALTQSGGALNLEGAAVLQANITMTGGSLNFLSSPTSDGFGTIKSSVEPTLSGTAAITAGVDGFSMLTKDSYILSSGVSTASYLKNNYNDDLYTISDSGSDTVLTLKPEAEGLNAEFGFVSVSSLDPSAGLSDPVSISDFSFKAVTANPSAFSEWLAAETGLETRLGSGYVNVNLGETRTGTGASNLVWDFSGYGQSVQLTGAAYNQSAAFVPEPSSWLLLILGALGLGWFRLRRR